MRQTHVKPFFTAFFIGNACRGKNVVVTAGNVENDGLVGLGNAAEERDDGGQIVFRHRRKVDMRCRAEPGKKCLIDGKVRFQLSAVGADKNYPIGRKIQCAGQILQR